MSLAPTKLYLIFTYLDQGHPLFLMRYYIEHMSELVMTESSSTANDRFIRSTLLRNTLFVPLATGEGLELGIVSCQVPELARAVSSLLTRSLENAKDTNGGHLPPAVVERTQRTIISPHGVANIWGLTGHRFALTRPAGSGRDSNIGLS